MFLLQISANFSDRGTSRRSFHHHRVVTPLRGLGTAQQKEFTNEPQTFDLIGAAAM
jgi:hypothetical protein